MVTDGRTPQLGEWWAEQGGNIFHRLYLMQGGSASRLSWHADCMIIVFPEFPVEDAESGILCKKCWEVTERFGDAHDRASIPLKLPMPRG